MKYVPIVPPGAEKILMSSNAERVFCYADKALQEPEYRFAYQVLQSEGVEILMDHPIYELKPALSLLDTLDVLSRMNPEITTVPDVHEDYEVTMQMFRLYAPAMHDLYPNIRLMGVPQGKDESTIWRSAIQMAESGMVNMLGIGIKRSIPTLDRARLVAQLHDLYPTMQFHLLGARWPYINECKMALMPWVESCDTAEPVSAGIRGIELKDAKALDVQRDINFQQMAGEALSMKRVVGANIWQMQELLAGRVTPEELFPGVLDRPSA